MVTEFTDSLLGKVSEYPQTYAPEVLQPIPRSLGRAALGLERVALPFVGHDLWNAYEVSWLNEKGRPEVWLMVMQVPFDSPNIVESKSFKLYLNSLNMTSFSSPQKVIDLMTEDLSKTVGARVSLAIHPMDITADFQCQTLVGECLDGLDVECDTYRVKPELLTMSGRGQFSGRWFSHLLRSCCPVTGQPDWATVIIDYKGQEITPESLLQYIVSYRNNQEFHEQCVERIFADIHRYCKPECLIVQARFTRRGGIDINPIRSTYPIKPENIRLIRQ